MTNALNKTNAAAVAQGPRFARLVRRGLAVCMLACVGLGAAHAQGQGRRDDGQSQPPRSDRFQAPPPQIEQPREQRSYDQMRDQQRAMEEQSRRQQMQQEQNGRDSRREGRLTPDERRDLRRQINEAGADIYPNARRR